MEEITMERLLDDFASVIGQINDIVQRKDIDQAREALEQIGKLVNNDEYVTLDDRTDYDHVLHELLSKISGVIEIKRQQPQQALSKNGRINEINDEIQRIDDEIMRINSIQTSNPEIERIKGQLSELIEQRKNILEQEHANIDDLKRRREELKRTLRGRTQRNNNNNEQKNRSTQQQEELKNLNNELEDLKNQLNNGPKKLMESDGYIAEGMPSPEQQFEDATGIKFDPNIYEIVWDGAEGEQNSDNPATPFNVVLRREAIQTRINEINEQINDLSRQENNEEIDQEKISDLERKIATNESLIATLNEDLRKPDLSEEDRNNILINRMRLNSELHDLRNELEAERNKGQHAEEENNEEIEELDRQIAEAEERQAKEQEEIEKINSEISNLENQILNIQQNGNILSDEDKEKLAELNKEKSRLKQEYDNIMNENKNQDSNFVTDRLDLGEEAKKIGDYIFKTAEIRKKLVERNVTREDLIEFYATGRDAITKRIEDINNQFNDLKKEAGELALDENGNNLCDMLNDSSLSEAKKILIFEKIRKNFEKIDRFHDELEKNGFLDEINTTTKSKEFEKFFNKYNQELNTKLTRLQLDINEQSENRDILNQQIMQLNQEIQAIAMKGNNFGDVDNKASEEKKLREAQIRITMFGPEDEQAQEIINQWDERVQEFASHRKTADDKISIRYQDEEGNPQTAELSYETVENYDKYEEDSLFLNLSDYKKYLEATSLYDSAEDLQEGLGLAILKRRLNLTGPEFDEYNQLLSENKTEEADEWLQEYIGEMKEYVSTYHGFTNENAVKAKTWLSAGSTLKAMKPVKGDLPMQTRIGNGVSNFFRFFGLRKPQFSQVNSKGEKVATIGSGVLTTLADVGIIGGITATGLLAGPIGLATWGAAYAAKGIVTAANVIRGRIEYKNHKDVIDKNLPTLRGASADDREVARKDYYRRQKLAERDGKPLGLLDKFTTWFHAKTDRLPGRGNAAHEVEEKIVQEAIELSNGVIDRRTEDYKEGIKRNAEKAEENQKIRQENYRKEAQRAETYNDIVRDPYSIDLTNDALFDKTAVASVARNALYGTVRPDDYDSLREDVNSNSKAEKVRRYVKNGPEFKRTQDLENVSDKGGTTANTAVTMEEKYTARQQRQDRINKVWTILLTAGLKTGIDYLRTGFKDQIITEKPQPAKKETQTVPGERKWVEGTTSKKEIWDTETTTEFDSSKKISDVLYTNKAKNDIYGGGVISETKLESPIDAVTLKLQTEGGRTIEVSLAEKASGLIQGQHVHSVIDENISDLTLPQLIEKLKVNDTENYKMFVEQLGLKENTPYDKVAEIVAKKNLLSVQTNKLEGWRDISSGNEFMKTVTRNVFKGYDEVNIPGHWEQGEPTIKEVLTPQDPIKVTNEVFNPDKLKDSILGGAATGFAVDTIDQLHEAANQSKKETPGTFEQRNPYLLMSRLAEEIRRQRQNEQRQQEEEQEEQDER